MNNWAFEQLVADILKHPKLLLIMDYDGTLVPIKDSPDLALPGPELLQTLGHLVQKPWLKMAIVSGRELANLQQLLPIDVFLAGCHGAEFQDVAGSRCQALDSEVLAPAFNRIAQIAEKCVADQPGYLLENKKYSFALHYRQADRASSRQVLAEFKKAVQSVLKEYNLTFLAGKMVLEIRSPLVDKGALVKHLMHLNAEHYPVYIGDDTTDEDAFKIIQGKGTGVLVAETDQDTAAALRIQEPGEVLKLLQILSTRC